ncbi:hypothetical protein Tco_0298450 [Tanacetum coccineum]
MESRTIPKAEGFLQRSLESRTRIYSRFEVVEDYYFPCIEQPHDNFKNGDLDVYESRQFYDEYERMFVEAVILTDNRLVKQIDITLEQWLDLKFRDHKKVDKEIIKEVVNTWLIQSYRKQFEEYMEIKRRRLEVNGINTDVECDPTNVEFSKWLASKFNNHKTMYWYIKNALWLYWKRGDDEVILTYNEVSDLEEEILREDTKIPEIFGIETDIFDFEIPLCKNSKNLIIFFKLMMVCSLEIYMDLRHMKIIRYEGLEDSDLKDEALKEKAILEGSWGHENREGENFCSWLKDCFKEEESSEDAWRNYSPNNDNDAIQVDQERFDNLEPIKGDDDDIGDLDDYLIPQDVSYYVNE